MIKKQRKRGCGLPAPECARIYIYICVCVCQKLSNLLCYFHLQCHLSQTKRNRKSQGRKCWHFSCLTKVLIKSIGKSLFTYNQFSLKIFEWKMKILFKNLHPLFGKQLQRQWMAEVWSRKVLSLRDFEMHSAKSEKKKVSKMSLQKSRRLLWKLLFWQSLHGTYLQERVALAIHGYTQTWLEKGPCPQGPGF